MELISQQEREQIQSISENIEKIGCLVNLSSPSKFSPDAQMVSILKSILCDNTYLSDNRTGIKTMKAAAMQFRLSGNNVPRLMGKYVNPRLAYTEMLWMVSGRNDLKWLQDHKVKYWNNWSDENGTIGKSYGYQFGKQIESLVEGLISDWNGRRHIINLWQFDDLNEMVLPPCVYGYQWVTMGEPDSDGNHHVNLIVNCRSCDVFLGGPYDIMFAYFLNRLVLDYVSMKTGKKIETISITFNIADCHVYMNQLEAIDKYTLNVCDLIMNAGFGEHLHIKISNTYFDAPDCKTTHSFKDWVEENILFLEDCLSGELEWTDFCYTRNAWCEGNVKESEFLRIETPVAI